MLDPLFFDRFTMAFSLAIHIILATIGMVLPILILVAEYLGIRYKDKQYKVLAKRLAIVFLIFFAVGTASGMLVVLNLTFLWPGFMAVVTKVAMLPVYVEVFAFFSESIFLALYLYSGKIFENSYVHVFLMGVVAVGAAASAGLITILNAFMNTPSGFNISTYLSTGTLTDINPLAVFTAPGVSTEVMHVLATSYFVGAALFLAYFAWRSMGAKSKEEKQYYQKAMKITFAILAITVVFAIITGIWSIETLYTIQPEKFAAIELNLNPMAYAPELIGGLFLNGSVHYALPIPDLQSILATGSASGIVPGLSQYPTSTWPPLIIHDMFDFMFFSGVLAGLLIFVLLIQYLRKKSIFGDKRVMWLFILIGALAVILLENGWMVDEFGRQPWIIYNVMMVSQAANPSPGIIPISIAIVALYAIILPMSFIVLRRIFSKKSLKNELR